MHPKRRILPHIRSGSPGPRPKSSSKGESKFTEMKCIMFQSTFLTVLTHPLADTPGSVACRRRQLVPICMQMPACMGSLLLYHAQSQVPQSCDAVECVVVGGKYVRMRSAWPARLQSTKYCVQEAPDLARRPLCNSVKNKHTSKTVCASCGWQHTKFGSQQGREQQCRRHDMSAPASDELKRNSSKLGVNGLSKHLTV